MSDSTARFEPIPTHPGLYRDHKTNSVINIRDFGPAHVIWTFREGPKHPNVRVATSMKQEWPFILTSVSAPLVGSGEGYFRLKGAAAPLVGVQQFKTMRAVLIQDEKELKEAELCNAGELEDEEIVIGFGVMRHAL